MSCCNGAKMILNLASKPDEQPLGCKCYKEAYSYFDNFKENAMLELSKECNLNVTPLNGDICGRSASELKAWVLDRSEYRVRLR
ncbi:hypothetical protein Peur_043988 [Populus x canadensis]